jgi:hypothetical protein
MDVRRCGSSRFKLLVSDRLAVDRIAAHASDHDFERRDLTG